ncbi:UvrD-helicase domain-containing protein [Bacillaceae bacterium SIJ1]|uniref:HelD family protein n=1 Tax=Litoribacterium kuwaitense TaxID=1398745 RepID=UPI0013ED147D|nr:UvrD-helicase domain-containing protein [Litoribacterium kuwaitense]NGP45067.1 UvrD-helicase domain-containing protein [Litoribacterium kuwaitense]
MAGWEEEKQYLSVTCGHIQEQLKEIEAIPPYIGDDVTEQALEHHREKRKEQLRRAMGSPYFGRLDFKNDEESNVRAYYIGKAGIDDTEDGTLLVIDWRAPVSSLFYGFTGGGDDAYYVAPEGPVDGQIYLKRNLLIRQAELQRMVDTYVRGQGHSGGGDEFLLYRLEENKDDKLRDIVSTIQAEQNDIIRERINAPLIIQGVAGSGKTTVALHRLAYLLYEYREKVRAEHMIIFAPNQMFLDYISDVLPELGVGDIQQTTFTEWALAQLDLPYPLEEGASRLRATFESSEDEQLRNENDLGSFSFCKQLETELATHTAFAVAKPFDAGHGKTLPIEKLNQWTAGQAQQPLASKMRRLHDRIKHWIDEEARLFEPLKARAFKKKAKQRLRSFKASWPETDAFTLYLKLLKQLLPEEHARLMNEEKIAVRDLAPLLLIHYRLNGVLQQRYDYVVIDEAQDVTPFQIKILNEVTKGASFTILGDMGQAIYGKSGVESWTELNEVFSVTPQVSLMKRSYRSTYEIVSFANRFLRRLGGKDRQAEPVFRSGQEVKVMKKQSTYAFEWVKQKEAQSFQSLAVLTRTEKQARQIHKALVEQGVQATLISPEHHRYEGGISVMPVYLAKGLEFDAVLLTNVDEDHYRDDPFHTKLLYVGCTRALHDLTLCYENDPSLLLEL